MKIFSLNETFEEIHSNIILNFVEQIQIR